MEGETLYSFVIGRLRDLLAEKMEHLKALDGVVDELAKVLKKLDDLLEYLHIRKDICSTDIIDLADQLIDSIEAYVFRVVNKHTCIRERLLRPKVCMAIEKITIKINNFINSQSGDTDASTLESRRPYKVQDLSRYKENDFVGREEDINKLASYLVDHEENEFRVISIYGMGGLGKTTLARKVYKDMKVLRHFQSFAFVCVSEQCQAKEILKHILQQLSLAKEEEMKSMSEADVIESLQSVQGEKRCLIIIDDIWSVFDWESLNCGLHDGSTGSKVLLTTRIKDVANKGFFYSLKCLSEDECWELCLKTIGKDRDTEIEKRREKLGRKMIAWCSGNPLAVLVLRGVLATKYSLREWERFYESRTWGGEVYQQFNAEVVEELFFSYKELPYPLRPCFLYMGTFAEDEKIDVETLFRLWDAEGMILSKDREVGETNMDVAERYLGELVGRCMIEAELADEVYPNVRRRYKICQVHDLMRKLCLSIVKKEDFLEVQDYRGCKDKVVVLNSTSPRNDTKIPPRQVLLFSEDFILQNDKHNATGHVRSLKFEGGLAGKLSKLKKLNLLRVLSFNHTSIGKEKITNELIHLRYLSLAQVDIVCLPPIYNFIYLQTLDMRRCFNISGKFWVLNLDLRKLKGLKHLFLPIRFNEMIPNFSRLRLNGLTKLETIVNLHSKMCEMEDVIQLTNLRRLEWKIRISSEDDGKRMKEFMNKVNLDPSRHSSLAIELVNPKVEMYSDVLRGKIPQCCEEILHELDITGVRGKLLSDFSRFSCLTQLTLTEFEVEEDPMPILEKLSNLKDLCLQLGKLKGKEMTCSTTGFPQLRSLMFFSIEKWEKWWVEEGAMPNLWRLSIWECARLELLPNELKYIATFQDLLIGNMPEDFGRRLIVGAGNTSGRQGLHFYKIPDFRSSGRRGQVHMDRYRTCRSC